MWTEYVQRVASVECLGLHPTDQDQVAWRALQCQIVSCFRRCPQEACNHWASEYIRPERAPAGGHCPAYALSNVPYRAPVERQTAPRVLGLLCGSSTHGSRGCARAWSACRRRGPVVRPDRYLAGLAIRRKDQDPHLRRNPAWRRDYPPRSCRRCPQPRCEVPQEDPE